MESRRKTPDFILMAVVLMLLSVGIVMVFSSSAVWAYSKHGDSLYFLKRQLLWAGLGLVTMFFMMNFDYWRIQTLSKAIMAVTILLLVLVLIPGVGIELNYARRWIGIGKTLTVQPSEVAKLGMVIFVANGISSHPNRITSFSRGIIPYMIVLGIVCLLILKQPDFSTCVLIAAVVMIIIFTGGAKISHLLGLSLAAVPLGLYLILGEEYRAARFFSFLNPWADARDTGYHIIQSLYALGSGGLIGLGLGKSRQKFFYLPEPQNDFIFAIIGEELGFIGAAIIISLFLILLWRGFKIALKAPDLFGALLATGITVVIGLQSFMNIAVVTASMPVTGIPLPFISAGGSSLILTLASMGILLNISRYSV